MLVFSVLAVVASLRGDPVGRAFAVGEAGVAAASLVAFRLLGAKRIPVEATLVVFFSAGAIDAGLHFAFQPLAHQPAGFVLLAMLSALVLATPRAFAISLTILTTTWILSIPYLEGTLAATGIVVIGTQVLAIFIFRARRVTTRRMLEALESEAQARERLARANADLDAFAGMASHDLKAPLRAIANLTAILDEDAGKHPEVIAPTVARIQRETARATALVDDLLAFSRAAETPIVLQTLDVTALVTGILDGLQARDPERRVETHIASGAHALADPGLLTSVFQNLLDNAWKYTRETPHPVITYETREDAHATTHTIRDNGIGFDPARKEDLFRPFVRLHDGTYDGTGLGLATVHRIVERHHGTITAESRPGQGTAFHITLPSDPHRHVFTPPTP